MKNGSIETIKTAGDAVSVGTIGATFLGWLPDVAAGFAIVWSVIRIYETKTFQSIVKRWRK